VSAILGDLPTSEPGPSTASAQRDEKQAERSFQIKLAIIVAAFSLIGSGGGVLVGYISTRAQIRSQQHELKTQATISTDENIREQRQIAYERFLNLNHKFTQTFGLLTVIAETGGTSPRRVHQLQDQLDKQYSAYSASQVGVDLLSSDAVFRATQSLVTDDVTLLTDSARLSNRDQNLGERDMGKELQLRSDLITLIKAELQIPGR
jgi:hypothetical protein